MPVRVSWASILGQHDHNQGLAIAIGLGIITLSVLVWALTSWASRRAPRTWQHMLGAIIRPGLRTSSYGLRSRQTYSPEDISPT